MAQKIAATPQAALASVKKSARCRLRIMEKCFCIEGCPAPGVLMMPGGAVSLVEARSEPDSSIGLAPPQGAVDLHLPPAGGRLVKKLLIRLLILLLLRFVLRDARRLRPVRMLGLDRVVLHLGRAARGARALVAQVVLRGLGFQ